MKSSCCCLPTSWLTSSPATSWTCAAKSRSSMLSWPGSNTASRSAGLSCHRFVEAHSVSAYKGTRLASDVWAPFHLLHALQVLQHVRLPLLSPKFLVGTVGSDPLIKSDEECRWVGFCGICIQDSTQVSVNDVYYDKYWRRHKNGLDRFVFLHFLRDLVDEAKNYLLLPQERPLMQGPRTRPRKPIRCGEVLFAG